MTTTPLIDLASLAAVDRPFDDPPPHTDEEVARLVALARLRNAHTVVAGHGLGGAPTVAAHVFAEAWAATGGEVVRTVTWPERAASWLRHANRFAEPEPDLWLMTGAPAGCAQMIRRLTWSTPWRPERTLGFASLARPSVIALAGLEQLEGLSGATTQGDTWHIVDRRLRTGRSQSESAA